MLMMILGLVMIFMVGILVGMNIEDYSIRRYEYELNREIDSNGRTGYNGKDRKEGFE